MKCPKNQRRLVNEQRERGWRRGDALPLTKVTNDQTATQPEPLSATRDSSHAAPPVVTSTVRQAANSPRVTSQQLQFLLKVTPPANESEREYGVPACITIAQAILESATATGWGSSSLFRLANNPFGIKYCHFCEQCSEPAAEASGPSRGQTNVSTGHSSAGYGAFDAATWEVENGRKITVMAQFQRFPNLAEAFRCHALLLSRSPRYAPAMAVIASEARRPESEVEATPAPSVGTECDPQKASDPGRRTSDTETDISCPAPDAWRKFAERLGPKTTPLDKEHCGYSTNPSYSAELVRLVELYRLNDPHLLDWLTAGNAPGARAGESA